MCSHKVPHEQNYAGEINFSKSLTVPIANLSFWNNMRKLANILRYALLFAESVINPVRISASK